MRLIAILLFLVLPICATAKSPQKEEVETRFNELLAAEAATPPPSCEGLPEESKRLCENLRKADEIAQTCELSVYRDPKLGLMREFCIIAYEPKSDMFHTIMLDMPVVVSEKGDFPVRVKTVAEPHYTVIRKTGRSFIKMRYTVYQGDDLVLYAYSSKHLRVPDANTNNLESVRKNSEPIVYLADHDHMDAPGIAEKGCSFARAFLESAHEDMKNVPSYTFDGMPVTAHITPDTLLKGIVAEQTDDVHVFGPRYALLQEKIAVTDPMQEKGFRRVCVHFFKNGPKAYRYIWSRERAGGVLQFTNKRKFRDGKWHDGTYDSMRFHAPNAQLDPDFRRGVQSIRNLGKAAIVYLDYALGNKNIAENSRKLFARDPNVGIMLGFAEYNGGPGQAKRLNEFITRYEKKTGKLVTADNFPVLELRAFGMHPETYPYLVKYWMLRNFRLGP